MFYAALARDGDNIFIRLFAVDNNIFARSVKCETSKPNFAKITSAFLLFLHEYS